MKILDTERKKSKFGLEIEIKGREIQQYTGQLTRQMFTDKLLNSSTVRIY